MRVCDVFDRSTMIELAQHLPYLLAQALMSMQAGRRILTKAYIRKEIERVRQLPEERVVCPIPYDPDQIVYDMLVNLEINEFITVNMVDESSLLTYCADDLENMLRTVNWLFLDK